MNGNCSDKIMGEDYFDFIVDYELASNDDLANMNICFLQIDTIFASIYVPEHLVPRNVLNEYGYKVFVRLFGLLDIASLQETGVTRIRNIPNLDLRGEGVLIGIIDTGIDYTHQTFLKTDGSTKIVSIWDQTIQSDNPPDGLFYGTEYTKEQINAALQSDDPYSIVPSFDEIGHGTFLAGIAAGNIDLQNNFSGVVPDAELVVVKLKPAKQNLRNIFLIPEDAVCYQENDIMLGVRYLLEVAARVNRPISICIGLGTSQGAHDSNGFLSMYLSLVSQMDGVAVAIAVGNEGNSKHHFESLMRIGTNVETAELIVGPAEQGFTLEMWGNPPNTFAIELTAPSGEIIPIVRPRLGESVELSFIFDTSIVTIIFKLVGSRSGAQLVIIRFQRPSEGTWLITIHKVNRTLDLNYHIWLPMSGFITEGTYFLNSSPYTTLTSPANAYIPITITAYNHVDNSLYINASRGFTRTGQTAPDLAAPGVNIIGPIPGNSYTTYSGTSIAAAHTTGVTAMLLEWGKVRGNIEYMDGTDVKNMLIRGAKRDSSNTYPNREWGYGILEIYGAFENLRGS